jgi:WD40 repeat protein
VVYLIDLETGALRGLRGHHEGVVAVAAARDGRTLASGGSDGEVRLWDLRSGASRLLATHGGKVWRIRISPEGTRIYSLGLDRTLRMTPVDGKGKQTWSVDCRRCWALDLSPDGNRLAVEAGEGVSLLSAETGTVQRTLPIQGALLAGVAFSPTAGSSPR